ncbi:helix-turn-helix domain-containing protein [Vallitalea maricola]|uniref:Uncharacterized protein n=1 Tax=Vallitalea maricola TaxID=3074433 RepID=A0ACB5ULT5_9FIRM|nr:hypothetical protein AN2V17_27580 [Vallitalea sp. AN17-2]
MFSKRLKLLRLNKNLSQKNLATYLNISPSTIGMYEQGRRQPDQETLQKLANYFNVNIDYLLGRTNNPVPLDSSDNNINHNKEIDQKINDLIKEVEKTDGLMFSGGPMDEPTREVLLKMLRTTKDMAEKMNENNKK